MRTYNQSDVLYCKVKEVAKEKKLAKATWSKGRKPYLTKICGELDNGKTLENACFSVAKSYPQSSRSRQTCLTCIRFIYEAINKAVPDSIESISTSYSVSSVTFEPLPSDEEIFRQYKILQLKNQRWANAYALMATYGLRNHEVFRCRLIQQSKLVCLVDEDSKTGCRIAFPYFPDAINRFNLTESIDLPKINGTDLQRIGQQVCLQFQRYKIPFPAYHLRRSYACRCIELNNDFVVAKSLGHSVHSLNQIYRKHIDPLRLAQFSESVFNTAS